MRVSAVEGDLAQRRADALLTFMAVSSLAIGALIYIFDRPPAAVYLLPQALSLADEQKAWFGVLGGPLPELVHVYAFILLTVVVSPWSRRALFPICGFWWTIASLAELGQLPALAPRIAALVPTWFQHVPVLSNTANYFSHGTFDLQDLVAVAIGSVGAFLSVNLVNANSRKCPAGSEHY
ncbi:MAG: hypothetical protein R3268_13100 [Acidiferrobacterales bacterium]|nr:hypothetical protein [Acidiferrobacterales bacterium]